jgi:hypothetical protein
MILIINMCSTQRTKRVFVQQVFNNCIELSLSNKLFIDSTSVTESDHDSHDPMITKSVYKHRSFVGYRGIYLWSLCLPCSQSASSNHTGNIT